MSSARSIQTVSLALGYVAAGVFWGGFAASTPDLQLRSGLGTAGFGALLLTMTLGAFPAMLAIGRVMARLERWAMPGALAFFAAAALVLSRAEGVPALAFALFLCGAASGGLDVTLNMRTSRIEEASGARLFNRMHAVFPLALLVASPVTGAARDAGATPAVIFPVLALGLAASAALEWRVGTGARPAPAPGCHGLRPPPVTAIFVVLAVLAALGAFLEMSAQAWAVIFAEAALDATATVAGLAAAAFTLGMSGGRLLGHMIEQRIGEPRLIGAAAALGVPAFLLVAVSGSVPLALLGLLLAGIATGPVEPTVFRIVASRSDPVHRGRALSIATMIAYLGYMLSPPVLGAVAQAGGWSAMWSLAAAIAALVAALALVLRRMAGNR